jgi:hypothetical protein
MALAESYLKCRRHKMVKPGTFNNANSHWDKVKNGVPEGSIFSSLLLSIVGLY